MTRHAAIAVLSGAVLITAGCAGTPSRQGASGGSTPRGGGYYQNDGPPKDADIDMASIPDAVPVDEPRSKYGNPARYEALGKTYYVLKSARGFTQTGRASWYGRQFHGQRTSSGEPYNMFKMTAAHKRLPIPSYVRVTRLDDGRHIIVRVNDRGPFHDGRIIDLSYVAARRLGIVAHGSAPVRIETVTPDSLRVERSHDAPKRSTATDQQRTSHPASKRPSTIPSQRRAVQPVSATKQSSTPGLINDTLYLQTGAFRKATNAKRLRGRLHAAGFEHTIILRPDSQTPLYRVRIGPFDSVRGRSSTRAMLANLGFAAREVERSPATQ